MTGRIEALTGHPETVQALVDSHITAASHGPAALDAALAPVSPETEDACYRALLDRTALTPVLRAIDARQRARAVTAHHEENAIRRGGAR